MLQPEFRKYAHFIEYDNLVSDTRGEIEKLYSFLGIDPFEHNYANIKNVTPENDKIYGVVNMHTVRKTISPSTTDARTILSEYAYNKYNNLEFWREALGC
jgi:sulfotransferase